MKQPSSRACHASTPLALTVTDVDLAPRRIRSAVAGQEGGHVRADSAEKVAGPGHCVASGTSGWHSCHRARPGWQASTAGITSDGEVGTLGDASGHWGRPTSIEPSPQDGVDGRMAGNEQLRRAMATGRRDVAAVARAAHVDPKTVQRWLSGRVPRPRHRWAVADLFQHPAARRGRRIQRSLPARARHALSEHAGACRWSDRDRRWRQDSLAPAA